MMGMGGTGPALDAATSINCKDLQQSPENSAAKSAALSLESALGTIIAAWPTLPEPIRRAMVALVG
jgi:hypothetical protein